VMTSLNDSLNRDAGPVSSASMVLHVRTVADSGGGPEKTILRSPRHVDPSRYRMAAAYIHPDHGSAIGDIRQRAAEQGCPLFGVVERGAIDRQTIRQLADLCRRLNVTIWHAHDAKSNLIGLLLRRKLGVKLISTVHGYIENTVKLRLYRKIDHALLRRYHRVVVVSPKLYDQCLDAGIDQSRMTYIPNGIEADLYQRDASVDQACNALDLPRGKPILGIAGRLSAEKQVDKLIAVFPDICRAVEGARLVIIGDGPERAALQEQVRQLGLTDRVHLVGWQNPLTPWYQAMDVLALTSSTEGLPNVLLEAMALGVPVAATAVGAIPDLLDGGRCGRLLTQDNTSWTSPLIRMLTDNTLRTELAIAARQRVETEFSFTRRMDRMMGQYDLLLDGSNEQQRKRAA
jgi:glycosyltransferase involved in cell wall biosynthesis